MITVRCLFLFPSALKYETLISANGFFKNVVTYYRIIISVWSLRPGLCWYVCVVFCSHPFSPTYTCTSGDKSFTSHLFLKKKSHTIKKLPPCVPLPPAVMSCYFLWKTPQRAPAARSKSCTRTGSYPFMDHVTLSHTHALLWNVARNDAINLQWELKQTFYP